jgi:cobalamin biosynthesis Mg chelatase CobN
MAGVLLGLGVVALTGPGSNLFGAQSPSATYNPPSRTDASLQTAATTSAGGAQTPYSVYGATSSTTTGQNASNSAGAQNPSLGSRADIASPSQVNSIASQPINLTGLALLPVLAAFLLGFVLYRVSRTRDEEEDLPEPA